MLTVKGCHLGFKFKFNLGKSIKSSKESGGGQAGGDPIDCGTGTEGVQEAGYKWARGGSSKGWEVGEMGEIFKKQICLLFCNQKRA